MNDFSQLTLIRARPGAFACMFRNMAATVWKGHLTFGLVSVPVKLFRAARAEKVHMHMLQRESGGRVRRIFVPAEDAPLPEDAATFTSEEPAERTNIRRVSGGSTYARVETGVEPTEGSGGKARGIPASDLSHGFEYAKDKYVEFEPRELDALAPRNSREMQILEFVKFAEVDPVYLENSYYVAPDKQGEKPYALLFAALQKTGQSAIAEFVMHRRDQMMLLRAGRRGIIGHSLFHEDEIRRDSEFHADSGSIVPKEMELAIQLINALAARFEPEKFKDKYRERLTAAISERITGGTTEVRGMDQAAPVIDITAALQASLAKAKKPATSEHRSSTAAAQEKKKRSGGSKG